MAITPVSDTAANADVQGLFAAIKGRIGMVPNLYRVMANRPAVLTASLKLGEELGKGSFDTATREAIALAVAGANTCDYCASAHTAISKGLKVDAAEIAQRLRGQSADPRTQAILTLAVSINETRGRPGAAAVAAARAAGLSDGDILEVVGNVVANIFTNYTNHIAETEIDFPVVRTA